MSASQSKAEQIYEAKLAEQAERYEEMVKIMDKLAYDHKTLSLEERNLLSVAFKNVIGARRASWRILCSIETKSGEDERKHEAILKEFKGKVEDELAGYCNQVIKVLKMLNEALSQEDHESCIFYQKMLGDYYRYFAEFQTGAERKNHAELSLQSYKFAQENARENLIPTHPVRLGLALNFSVLYYEILNAPEKACRVAKQAFDEAIAELETLNEESYKDSTLIMQLLRDNLTLWTSDMTDDGQKDEELKDVDSNDGN